MPTEDETEENFDLDERENKYMETLELSGEWLTIWDWAAAIGEDHPVMMEEMERRGATWSTPVDGVRVIYGDLHHLSRFNGRRENKNLVVNNTGSVKEVRYFSDEELKDITRHGGYMDKNEVFIVDLTRRDIVKRALTDMEAYDLYRLSEFETIRDQLNKLFRADFEVDHASALLNPDDPGSHHPNNFQILAQKFNRFKHSKNWPRFTWTEQVEHLEETLSQNIKHKDKLDISGSKQTLDALINRLSIVYEEENED